MLRPKTMQSFKVTSARSALEKLSGHLSLGFASLAFIVYFTEVFREDLTAAFLLIASLTCMTYVFVSSKQIDVISPLFVVSLVFTILIFLGLVTFTYFHHRPLSASVYKYSYAAFLSLFIGTYIGQIGGRRVIKSTVQSTLRVRNVSVLKLMVFAGFSSFLLMCVIKGGVPLFADNVNAARTVFTPALVI